MKATIPFLLTALLALVAPRPASAQSQYYGTAVWHNGTVTSDPAGSGDVDVAFDYAFYPHSALYDEIATHEVQFTYAPGPSTAMYNRSFISNRTGASWTGFVIRIEGGDFSGYGNTVPARAVNPLLDTGNIADYDSLELDQILLYHPFGHPFSLLGSSIERFNEQPGGFADARLTITFDDPVQTGWSFILDYNVIPSPGAPGAPGFTMYLTPIPEPATALLLTAGALLGSRSRRRR
jgi:hypothetical protein